MIITLHPQKNHEESPHSQKAFLAHFLNLFINHHPTILSFPIREVKELAAAVDDRLVERKAACFQDFQQMVRTGGAIAIGGLAQAVLAAGHATDKAVQLVRAIAAQDGDRLTQTVAKRLQQPLDQPPDIGRGDGVGRFHLARPVRMPFPPLRYSRRSDDQRGTREHI